MPDYFFDTSALAKNYHNEVGTQKVEQLLKKGDMIQPFESSPNTSITDVTIMSDSAS